jgi:hypothetical protein
MTEDSRFSDTDLSRDFEIEIVAATASPSAAFSSVHGRVPDGAAFPERKGA